MDKPAGWRHLLDLSSEDGAANWPVRIGLFLAIAMSVASADTLSLTDLPADWRMIARDAGILAALLFAAEYAWRLWRAPLAAPDDPAARRHYALSFLGIADLITALPLLLLISPRFGDIVLLPQLLALFKLARLTPALSLVATVVRNEAHALLAGLLVMAVLLVVASGVIYLLERDAQPAVFTSLPHSLWWAIVTMATVGYGDMIPVTVPGRIFGGMVMLLGIAMFAVPAGILASGFATELRRRDFVVTWQAVARVPLFATLDAARIAEISRLLKPEIVPARRTIVRRGETADAMYFIMDGEVEIDIAPQPVRLEKGHFFGEIALIRDTTRTATVTALTECRLLALEAADFRHLMRRHEDLRAKVMAVAESRLGGSLPDQG